MPKNSRLITPSQLSLFSISPVIEAWWEELQAQKLWLWANMKMPVTTW